MKVAMPTGGFHGWGIAGRYLTAEMAKLPWLEGVALHCIRGADFRPLHPEDWRAANIGYCFFENDIEALPHICRMAKEWDHVVAGSTWCEHHLKIGGMKHTSTILQGVDPLLFYPAPFLTAGDRFVVYSGGKFELRKSQDIVIAAMKIFMDRHADAWLSCSWHNDWEFSMATMAASPFISYRQSATEPLESIRRALHDNGLDLGRIVLHPPLHNSLMRDVYADSHIGLFPNRCEGGNNMVMCEYMACGRPVIASDKTGHADVINAANAFSLTRYSAYVHEIAGKHLGVWLEPDLEEVLAALEYAYEHRDEVSLKGLQAAADMKLLSWSAAASRFHAIAETLAGAGGDDGPRSMATMGRGDVSADGEALFKRANMLREAGEDQEAERCYLKAAEVAPGQAAVHYNLGRLYRDHDRLDGAREAFARAIAADPAFHQAHNNLGVILQLQGNLKEAAGAFRQAVSIAPGFADGWFNLGHLLEKKGEWQEAIECCRRAIAIDSGNADAHFNLATLLLLGGDFPEGWREYEWRWQKRGFSTQKREWPIPLWDGAPLEGKTILLDFEQGVGDVLQFIRYAPLVAARGGRVMVMTPKPLQRLMRGVRGIDIIRVEGEKWGEFHTYVPLMSLPRVCATTLETIPADVPYLAADAGLIEKWRQLTTGGENLRVGLVWAGGQLHENDLNRSLPLKAFQPLMAVDGISFYSLQVGDARRQLEALAEDMPLIDLTGHIDDFADTAALIANLDLVIAVDTAVAHLAGAMGKPVWTLLPHIPDWRWLLQRSDSPWYPTMRLFRQHRVGAWPETIAEVCQALQAFRDRHRRREPAAARSLPAKELIAQGAALYAAGNVAGALTAFTDAATADPANAEARNNLGVLLEQSGRWQEAAQRYREAIALAPAYPEAFYNLGNVLKRLEDGAGAMAAYRQALALRPGYGDALFNLANSCKNDGRLEEAVCHYRELISVEPARLSASLNLGGVLQALDRPEEAVAVYRQALARQPDHLPLLINLNAALVDCGRIDEAMAVIRGALGRAPENPDLQWNLALLQLMQGNLAAGWQGFDLRPLVADAPPPRPFPMPLWDGSDLRGRTILVHCEQGIGDTLQFIRYVPVLAARGARVLVECQVPELRPILEPQAGISRLVVRGEALPPADCHLPLMSLPGRFGTTLDTIPARVPYLAAPDELVCQWRLRLPLDGSLRVGLVWSGRQDKLLNRNRSCPLAAFAPLAAVSGVTFYSLQVGDGAEQAASPPAGMSLTEFTAQIGDFADTAALIANLDMVITIDTSVAHLAGAMGCPVWTLLKFSADWRWLRGRTDSPWYPTMRLFRQEKPGDWPGVILQVREALTLFCQKRKSKGMDHEPAPKQRLA